MPQVPVHGIRTLSGILSEGMAPPRFLTLLMASFAGIGLLLTATGLYGLLAYSVSRRTREIGVRMALGASRRSIVSMVLSRAVVLIAIGTLMGGAGVVAGLALLQRVMFTPGASYPFAWLFGAVAIVLLDGARGGVSARRPRRINRSDDGAARRMSGAGGITCRGALLLNPSCAASSEVRSSCTA